MAPNDRFAQLSSDEESLSSAAFHDSEIGDQPMALCVPNDRFSSDEDFSEDET